MKKMKEEIYEEIIKVFLQSKVDNLTTDTIAKGIGSNWITASRYLRRLAKKGVVSLIIVEGKIVGSRLNLRSFNLIDKVLFDLDTKEPSIFNQLIKNKRITIKYLGNKLNKEEKQDE